MTNKMQKNLYLNSNTVELLDTLSYLRGVKQGALIDDIISDYAMRMDESEKSLVMLVLGIAKDKGGFKEFDKMLSKLVEEIGGV